MHQSPQKLSGSPRREKYGNAGLADEGEGRVPRWAAKPASGKALRRNGRREEFSFEVERDRPRR